MKSFSERRIAILGRGIAGLALGYRLMQKGLRPTLFGRLDDSASRCAQGVVANKGLVFFESPLFAAKLTSLTHIQAWLDELEQSSGLTISRRFQGISEPYWDAEDFQDLVVRIYRRHFLGCHRTVNQPFVPNEAWPFLTRRPAGYFYYPADGWFDVVEALNALAALTAKGGIRSIERAVVAIDSAVDGGLSLTDDAGLTHGFDQVILATGAGTPQILESLLPRLPKMFSIGGQTLEIDLPVTSLLPLTQVRKTLSAIWWQRKLLIGASSWKGAAIDAAALALDTEQLLAKAGANFGWDVATFDRRNVKGRLGTRLRFADRMPAVGSLPHEVWRNRIFLCTGFYKNGLQLADLCAQDLVAELEDKPLRYPAFNPRRLFNS